MINHPAGVLDHQAVLVDSNRAWREARPEKEFSALKCGVGESLLSVCREYEHDPHAYKLAADVRALINEPCRKVRHCHGQGSKRRILTLNVYPADGFPWILLIDRALEGERSDGQITPRERSKIRVKERQRISRELHDSTSQHLTAIKLLLALAHRELAGAETKRLIDAAAEAASEALKEIRSFSYLLHPHHIRADGLIATLRHFIDGYARRTELPIRFEFRGRSFPRCPDVETAIFRIVQEALANVHRHANASEAWVDLTICEERALLTISDDGLGLGFAQANGVGFAAMRERAIELGGVFLPEIGSDNNSTVGRKGTRLRVEIPLPDVERQPRRSKRIAGKVQVEIG